jgi:hypothetical protein
MAKYFLNRRNGDYRAEASVIREYAAELVPGLLQTEDYYRAFLSTAPADAGIDRKIEVRTTRQKRLADDDRPQYWAVLNESVIRRTVGGPQVMRGQFARIPELAGLPGVTIQVLPFSAGAHPAMEGPFSILGFPEPVDPDVVYLENQAGSVYLEEADEIDRYAQVITHLIAKALSPDDSATLIEDVVATLWRGSRLQDQRTGDPEKEGAGWPPRLTQTYPALPGAKAATAATATTASR